MSPKDKPVGGNPVDPAGGGFSFDQYEGRAKAFNDDLGGVISSFAVAAVLADKSAKDASLQRLLEVLKYPNVDLDATTTLVGAKSPLETKISVPPVVLMNNQSLEVQSATLHMSMNVSAQDAAEAQAEYGGTLNAEGKIGWGPFSLSAKMSAQVSVSSSRKRSSDYSSTTDAQLVMAQSPAPEGLAKVIDAIGETVAVGLKLNEQIMKVAAGTIAKDLLPATPKS